MKTGSITSEEKVHTTSAIPIQNSGREWSGIRGFSSRSNTTRKRYFPGEKNPPGTKQNLIINLRNYMQCTGDVHPLIYLLSLLLIMKGPVSNLFRPVTIYSMVAPFMKQDLQTRMVNDWDRCITSMRERRE